MNCLDGGNGLGTGLELSHVVLDHSFNSGREVEKGERSWTLVGVRVMRWFQSASVTLASLSRRRMSWNLTCSGSWPDWRMTWSRTTAC